MPSSRLTFDDESMPQPRPPRWRMLWRLSFAMVFAAWSLLLLAWLTLHWGILPNARSWLPQIEQQASRALGTTVRIGDIRVRSSGWVPVVELDDVVLLDPSRREVLRLPSVVAAPAARSLPALELRLQQLLIDGAELEVRRDARGTIRVAGFLLEGDASQGDDRFAKWLFRQREVVVRGARLRWVDEQRTGEPLELQSVDLVVRNGVRSRDFRLDATPPAGWGDRFTLLGRFTTPLLGAGNEWRRWSGSLHADLPRVDVEQLRRHVSLPFELNGGGGALRAWADVVQGEASAVTVDVALAAVALRLADDLEPLLLQQVQGRLAARRDGDATTWSATDFGFTDGDGHRWPAGDLSLTLRGHGEDRASGPASGGEFRAERLDLALMASVAGRLPMGAAARGLLDELQPAGIVEPVQARWDGPLDSPTHYHVQATVRDLATAARPSQEPGGLGRPGWSGATIELDASERGGHARLSIDDGTLVLPGVFEQPAVPLEDFSAGLSWRVESRPDGAPPDIELQVSGARFGNADARGTFDAVWRSGQGEGFARGGRFPGRLELRGRLDEAHAQAVARYLPLGLSEATRRYIERAVRGGKLSGGRFHVEGDLWDFPFAGPGQGTFRIGARAEAVDFAYVPDEPGWTSPWPAFTAVSGDIEFDRVSMAVRNGTARVYGLEVSGVTATIADMVEAPVLQLDGLAQGPVNDLLHFLAASPVGGWLGGALAQATAEGRGRLQLSIGVPLDHLERSTVRGVLRLDGNGFQFAPDLPPLADAHGEVEFTDAGFVLRDVRGRVLGGDMSLEGGLQAEGGLQVTARGHASAEALRTQTQWPALATVARVLRGEAAFRLKLDWGGGSTAEPAVDLASDLVGMAIDLPAPIGKEADTPLPLRWAMTPLPTPDAPARWRDEVHVTLGTRVEAHYRREFDADRVRVLGGGIGVQVPAPRPDVGVTAVAALEALDVGAWRAALERLAAGGPAVDSGYVPQRIDLRAGALRAEGRRLSTVVASVSKGAAGAPWRATVEADQLAGTVEWQPGGEASAPGGVHARLSRLYLPPAESSQAEAWLGRPTSTVPALDIVVDDFAVGSRSLGRLEVEAVNVSLAGAAGGHEWQLARLGLENPQASLHASGRWRPASGALPARMATNFRLDLIDAGGLLARLGMPDALRGGAGTMQGEVSWRGSPLAPHAPSMNGTLHLAMRSGKFLQADSGAARVLSVLSLQALPRRLTLDFRDVFEEGFEFDEASGDVTITEGVAHTNNLRMRGLQAGVLMEGQADLAKETQDLRVIVVPEINAGTASLLYSIINPVVGLGTFVAQLFLRQPLMEAGTREFHVSGSWEDPKVERVERAAAAPPPNPSQ